MQFIAALAFLFIQYSLATEIEFSLIFQEERP